MIRRATLADAEAYDLQKHKTLLGDPDVLPEDRELKRLYLLTDHQQSGLGSTLIELVLDWIGPRTAWLGVWSQNFGAQRFYHRYGFSKAGEYFFKVGNHRDHEFIYRCPAPSC
ncbi:GNAT family N-acetyltransferase [Corynebacterium diphtheriae]|uniref:GNAT family N-acetyltransferase n=1 Tax=Corynebacterium diphtheriae TaxID=1717 RepID=UPI001FD0C81E|nr:GNAT family N-acetyltransferase [Corynebacterium diphtheriae]